jgi:hypothetical protein
MAVLMDEKLSASHFGRTVLIGSFKLEDMVDWYGRAVVVKEDGTLR